MSSRPLVFRPGTYRDDVSFESVGRVCTLDNSTQLWVTHPRLDPCRAHGPCQTQSTRIRDVSLHVPSSSIINALIAGAAVIQACSCEVGWCFCRQEAEWTNSLTSNNVIIKLRNCSSLAPRGEIVIKKKESCYINSLSTGHKTLLYSVYSSRCC